MSLEKPDHAGINSGDTHATDEVTDGQPPVELPFISYAQNFEDVMLWRALKHINNGFYVDVGANRPIMDSVSKAFYDRGWRGIHIEPVPEFAELLRQNRPDERVLEVALGAYEGVIDFNVVGGLSTAVAAHAEDYVKRGISVNTIQVPVLTLKSALASMDHKEVHWLKIDVEGFEKQVLEGWDSRILRPWVMVIEATIPCSPKTNFLEWEPILTDADYQFVYFDGLNRFYVAKEHSELFSAFECPPNVFDRARLSGHSCSDWCKEVISRHQLTKADFQKRTAALLAKLEASAARELELIRQLKSAEDINRTLMDRLNK